MPFPVTTKIRLHPPAGVFGSGVVVCRLEKSVVLLRWGLDLVDHLELCQGLMFLFRGLGCRRVSLLVPPAWLGTEVNTGQGWDLAGLRLDHPPTALLPILFKTS